MKNKKATEALQVGRFGLVGILNTVIDYVLFIGLTRVFQIPLDRVWTAKVISGAVAMLNSFYFNKTWVFKNNSTGESAAKQIVKFFTTTLVAVFIIQLGLVQLFSSEVQWPGLFAYDILTFVGLTGLLPEILTEAFTIKTVAFGIATVGSMTWNFVLYKFWAFKA